MHIAIIGNGISGVTAARYLRKLGNHAITIISAESEYFFSRTALMYVYMGHTTFQDIKPYEDGFWKKNRIDLVQAYVQNIDVQGKKLVLSTGNQVQYDKLILATGSKSNKFGWPGQDLRGVQGLYSYQDLISMEEISPRVKRAVIVGGGLIGIEMAEMFHSRNIPVTFLVRESSYWDAILPAEESQMINRHIYENNIDLRLESELKEIRGDSDGGVKEVETKNGEVIACEFVGLTAGVHPNIDLVKNSEGIEIDRGILVNAYLETSAEDVYAIGDCAQFRDALPGRRSIEQVWYTGKMHGKVAAFNILKERRPYNPGPWFNSAKFFDIEYQVYGDILASPPQHIKSLYWEHKSGKKSIRIQYDAEKENQVKGIHLMGIRMQHRVWDKWLREEQNLDYILDHLKEANFDPEFYTEYSKYFKTHAKELVS